MWRFKKRTDGKLEVLSPYVRAVPAPAHLRLWRNFVRGREDIELKAGRSALLL